MVPNGTCVATRDMAMANDSSLYAYYTAAVEWSDTNAACAVIPCNVNPSVRLSSRMAAGLKSHNRPGLPKSD